MEEGIFKGGTLIINLDSIKMINNDYVFQENDKVRIALKKNDTTDENVLYDEINAIAGETEIQKIFTAEQTMEKLEVNKKYIIQADLITKDNKVFPMYLQEVEVIGTAIIPEEKAGD